MVWLVSGTLDMMDPTNYTLITTPGIILKPFSKIDVLAITNNESIDQYLTSS